jgi:hypothetical protein
MEFQWEMHKPDPTFAFRERVRATINAKCVIYINITAFKALGEPEAVLLMYDRRKKTIGVMGCSANRHEAYPLKRKGNSPSNGRSIYARAFCKDFGIKPSETLVFKDSYVNKDAILLLNLNAVKPCPRK